MFSSKNFYSSASEKSNVKVRHSKKTCQENRKRKHQSPASACYLRLAYSIYIKIKNLLFAVFVHLLECKKGRQFPRVFIPYEIRNTELFWGDYFWFFFEISFARIICFVWKIIVKHHIISANTNGSKCSSELLQICLSQIFGIMTPLLMHMYISYRSRCLQIWCMQQ